MANNKTAEDTFNKWLAEIEKNPYRTVLEFSMALGVTRGRIYQLWDMAKDFGYELAFKMEVREIKEDGKKQRSSARKTKKDN